MTQSCKYRYPIYRTWMEPETIGVRCQGVKRSQMDLCETIRRKGLCPKLRQKAGEP
jgi:hypothetical protein